MKWCKDGILAGNVLGDECSLFIKSSDAHASMGDARNTLLIFRSIVLDVRRMHVTCYAYAYQCLSHRLEKG